MPNLLDEKFEPIIGLEVHVELKTESKMFCSCSTKHFGVKPNTHVCPVCLGLPGALPVANKKAMEWTVLTGLALNCQIANFSKFDRKNYFYPDLPKGYQISQYDLPLCRDGRLDGVRLRRVHLEEDTAKLIHTTAGGGKHTLIDFNRSGVPLMEIVTEPDITSALQAKTFLQKLQQIVRYLGVSEADMEKGQMRCEPTVNLKIEKKDRIFYTPLVEIKNINSFRFVQKAIEFEISRQLEEFKKIGMEKSPGTKTTRGWDEIRQETILQREKEEAADYRYFPEPDLPPIKWRNGEIKKLRNLLPELPGEKIERFEKQYGLPRNMCLILTETKDKADYFEEAVKKLQIENLKLKIEEIKKIANIIINKKVDTRKVSPAELVEKLAREKLKPVMAVAELELVVMKVLKENQKAIEDYKKGKVSALEFLVGQVVRETKGKADPNLCRKLLLEALDAS